MRLAFSYPYRNSNSQADMGSKSLQHVGMGLIENIQRLRRSNLARLRRERGANKVADLTGMPQALLYQMALGNGKSARNIKDEAARAIERACGVPEGWLDCDHERPEKGAVGWPFSIGKDRFDALQPEQQSIVEKVLIATIEAQEGQAPAKKHHAG